MVPKCAFEILLRLYPRDFRAKFAAEMSIAFEEALQDHSAHGRIAYVRFAAVELVSFAARATIEWIAKLTTDASVRGRILPDRLRMRPPGVSWETHWGAGRN